MIKHFFLIFLSVSCLGILNTYGQSAKVIRNKYEYARQLIKQQKYVAAEVVLEDLLKNNDKNLIKPNTLYLHAVAAYHNKEVSKATLSLETILQKHNKWEKANDARFFLATIASEEQAYTRICELLSPVAEGELTPEMHLLYETALQHLSAEELVALQEKFPKNKLLGKSALHAVLLSPEDVMSKTAMEKLIKQYGGNEQAIYEDYLNSGRKSSYNVAVFFPFFQEKTDPQNLRISNEFVYDIYKGMLLAEKQLLKEGIEINLLPFDTQRDTSIVKEILENPDMKGVDLIVGPLYGETLGMVKNYSNKTQTPMVNPISMNSLVFKDADYSFLLSSSYETLGEKLASYHHAQRDTAKAYIIYGASSREKAMAKTYLDTYDSLGDTVAVYSEYDYANRGFITAQEDLRALEMDDSTGVALDSTSAHVFISLTREAPSRTALGALQSLNAKAPVYVPDTWLEYNQLGYDLLESGEVNIVAPNYTKENSRNARMFEEEFLDTYFDTPDKYAYQGFETVYFFGKMLQEHGKKFYLKLSSLPPQEGYLYPQHDYRNSQDNQYIPIVRFIDGQLEVITIAEGEDIDVEEEEK
ncbi:ABC transporter substrate-binding protein [Algivirga pacifica]|uniref:Leucine-binding protein domain-containing protein n=1 Tax=Algivirga pacifica TaxID=1162670 RepID=A0ABP9DCN7_9BACT